jgi:hypothetical protein
MWTELAAPLSYFITAAGIRGACRYEVGREEVDLNTGAAFSSPNDTASAAGGTTSSSLPCGSPRQGVRLLERGVVTRPRTAPTGDWGDILRCVG